MTTTNEWRDLPTFEDVAEAKRAGNEIEVNTGPHWESWKGTAWMNYMEYRARAPQPKKVKLLGWRSKITGALFAFPECGPRGENTWERYPKLDDEVEDNE